MAVFRRFLRLFCGAIFALSVVFVSQNAFAVSCSTGTAGQYKITKYCYSCPAGCYCSGQDANGLDPSGNGKVDISESDVIAWCNSGTTCPWTAGSGQCGQSDAAHIYRCPSSHPNSATSATAQTKCYKTTSLAAGKYLDAIGSVLDCPRNYYCPSRTSFNAYYGKTYNNNQCPKSGYSYITKDGQSLGSTNTDDSNWTGTNTVNTKSSQITECYRYKNVSKLPGCTAGEVRQFFTNTTIKQQELGGTVVHTLVTSSYGGNLTIGTALKAANGYYVNGTQCSACAANAQQPSYGSSVTYCTCKDGYSGGGGTSDPSGANCVATNVDVDINSVTISDCPAYESTDEADTAHFKPNSVVGNTKTGSDYYYYIVVKGSAQNNSGLSRCQTFFNVDNSLIPHTATDIPGYTHTMIRAVYSVADINANGYTASANNYNRSAQIQFSGVSRNISLHCEDGYANKLAANGMIYYSTLNEALANACTKIENGNYSDDGVVERVCPIGYYCENGEKTECPTGTTSPAGSTSVDQCVASSYTITYNLNSGTGCSNTTYTSSDTVTLCTPTRDGYAFAGWYDNVNLTGTAITEIASGSTGDKVYYAKWEQAKFTITTTGTTDSFKFRMSAAGTFYVDCGDGGVLSGTGVSGNKIDRENNTSDATYTCTYSAAGAHTLRFGGSADGYNASQAAIRFNISASPSSDENAEKIASISGSLGRIFRTRVNATVGNPQPKFIQTFSVAKNMICQIPADLFDGIYGSPVEAMFSSTFDGCSGLTGSIPETLFCQNPNNPGVNNCIYGTPAQNMFVFTFNGCSSLTGTDISDPYNPGKKYAIPPKLFVGISGDPASAMFKATFQNCSKLAGTIPSGLFANIVGSPKGEMFCSTFRGCKKLTGSIPATLFSGISGAPATQMFDATFYNCSGLTGSISSDLFAGISGDPKSEMFGSTFHNCSGLNSITEGTKTTTYIPGTFLSSINTASASETGNPALNMFYGTNLDDSCPIGTRNVTRPPFNNAAKPWCALNTITLNWNENGGDAITNESCVYGDDLELPSAPTRTGYTFAGWKTADNVIRDAGTIITEGCTNTYTGVTQGYSTAITAQWTEIEYPFTITTTSMTANDTFKWSMSAAGTFYVDCGDGGVLSGTGVSGNTITRSNTTMAQYTCTYPNAGTHTIRMNGTATGYNATSGNSASYAAIGFSTENNSNNTPTKIAGISGSLGAIFGTIGNGDTLATQPRFSYTFDGCSGLTGSIPENLFAGISGAPAPFMFEYTFFNCSGLTGAIPENLFAGISGAPATYMFSATFYGCSGLTGSIPENLFAGISGAPAEGMFGFAFYKCSGLTGSIPEKLFAGISGAPASDMFSGTFYGCSGLTGSIPENLFAGVSGAPAGGMFSHTFAGCSGLTGSIPEKLFAGISGAPAQYMFNYTFAGCSKLTGFTDETTTTSYVPADFLSGITTNTSVSDQVNSMFTGTGLSNPCPANTYNVTPEQFSDAGKPWCAPCPTGTHYNGTGATSVNQCCLSGYDWNGTTCASLTISLSYTDSMDDTIYDGPNSCNINETFILPPAPMKTGYTFAGWTLVEN